MKAYAKVICFLLVAFALADLAVYKWFLPKRFLNQLKESMGGQNLNFHNIELNWAYGHFLGGTWKSPELELSLEEGSFSYSSIDWLMGHDLKIGHLRFKDFRLRILNSEGQINLWDWVEKLRQVSFDLPVQSIDVSGRMEFGDNSIPFSLFAGFSEKEKNIKAAIELRMSEIFDFNYDFLPLPKNTLLKLSIQKQNFQGNEIIKVSIRDEKFFNSKIESDGIKQKIFFDLYSGKPAVDFLNISAERGLNDEFFTGEWNSTLSSITLSKTFPIFSLLSTNVEGRGRVSFDSFIEKFRISGEGEAMVSSFLLPSEGNINGSTKFVLSQNDQNLSVEHFYLELRNEQEEKIVCSLLNQYKIQSNFLDFALFLKKVDFGRFSNHFLKKSLISGKVSGSYIDGNITLRSERLNFKNSSLNENLKIDFIIEKVSDFFSDLQGKFYIQGDISRNLITQFIPYKNPELENILSSQFQLEGHLLPKGWIVEKGEFYLFGKTVPILEAQVAAPINLRIDGTNQNVEWNSPKIKNPIRFNTGKLDYLINFSLLDLQVVFSNTHLNGEISLENEQLFWVIEDLEVPIELLFVDKNKTKKMALSGISNFYPMDENKSMIDFENLVLKENSETFIEGNFTFQVNKKDQINKVSGSNVKIEPSFLSMINKWEFIDPNLMFLDARKFLWEKNKNEKIFFDGSLNFLNSENNTTINKTFQLPIKWTYATQNQNFSHWVSIFFDKINSRMIELNYDSDLDKLKIHSEKLHVGDLINLFQYLSSCIDNSIRSDDFVSFLLGKKIDFKISELIIRPDLILNDLWIHSEINNESIEMELIFNNSKLLGSLLLLPEEISDGQFKYKINLNGQGVDLSVLNHIFGFKDQVGGNFEFKTEIIGNFDDYSIKNEITFENLVIDFFPETNKGDRSSIEDLLQSELGKAFSLSETQRKILKLLEDQLSELNFNHGQITFTGDSKYWKFNLVDWRGENNSLEGSGMILKSNHFKINLYPGFRGEWESLLEAVNLLADGKRRNEFRLLRNEPLVIEGDKQNIKLTNLWKLLGEGMGVEPFE